MFVDHCHQPRPPKQDTLPPKLPPMDMIHGSQRTEKDLDAPAMRQGTQVDGEVRRSVAHHGWALATNMNLVKQWLSKGNIFFFYPQHIGLGVKKFFGPIK